MSKVAFLESRLRRWIWDRSNPVALQGKLTDPHGYAAGQVDAAQDLLAALNAWEEEWRQRHAGGTEETPRTPARGEHA